MKMVLVLSVYYLILGARCDRIDRRVILLSTCVTALVVLYTLFNF